MTLPNFFGADVAARYDEGTAEMSVDAVVEFLADLTGDGAALEFGIGTGRIALPLAERGVRVSGIDLSPEMLGVLRSKPGAEVIDVTIGDFATTRVDGWFSLVYLVFNTIGNLTTQEAQIACFENAAAHLAPGGCFVIEVGVGGGPPIEVFDLGEAHVGIDEYEAATQRLVSHHFTLVDGRWERNSVPFRSVSPGELDLMARLGGLQLRERWSDWGREPFIGTSTKHVSVWERS